MTFDEWLKYGYTHGWCGHSVCYTHGGAPMSKREAADLDDGIDACIPIVRLYDSIEIRNAAENSYDIQ